MAALLVLIQAAEPLIELHHFGAPDPSWTVRDVRLRLPLGPDDRPKDRGDGMVELRRDGLIPVGPGERAPVVWTERRWFDGRRIARIFLYDGAMRLRLEFDDCGDELYTCYRHPDGSTAGYTRTRGRDYRFIEGFSDDGKSRRFVIGGNGELTLPGLRSGDREDYWIRGGEAVVWREFRLGRCTRIQLSADDASLSLAPGGEFLSMDDEFWNKRDGGGASYQPKYFLNVDGRTLSKGVKPKPDVRELPMFGSSHGIVEEWAAVYPKRRAAFLARVEARLAGRTWESLGLAFVREGAPWPR